MAEKMVRSLLDTDVYKFTTSYAYMKNYPDAEGEFSFIDRNNTEFSIDEIDDLRSHIYRLGELGLTNFEMDWCIKNIPFIPRYYWEWLRCFHFDVKKINVNSDDYGHLQITVYDKLYKVTLYEVPILAIVSEWMSKKYKDVANISNYINNETILKYDTWLVNTIPSLARGDFEYKAKLVSHIGEQSIIDLLHNNVLRMEGKRYYLNIK